MTRESLGERGDDDDHELDLGFEKGVKSVAQLVNASSPARLALPRPFVDTHTVHALAADHIG